MYHMKYFRHEIFAIYSIPAGWRQITTNLELRRSWRSYLFGGGGDSGRGKDVINGFFGVLHDHGEVIARGEGTVHGVFTLRSKQVHDVIKITSVIKKFDSKL